MQLSVKRSLHLFVIVAPILFYVVACNNDNNPPPASETTDIFREDENGKRRKKATNVERLWTISMNGCTGHLISPEYMMTANHCSPRSGASYTSGAAMNEGRRGDITVTRVAESSAALDYAILQIRWNGARPKNQKYPPLVATKASDVNVGSNTGQGDEIFTVGFPGDKTRSWGATYAEGRAKQVAGNLLRYNIGIINGNSGGGVWRKSDGMLVSLTNGGPTVLGSAGWNGNDKNNSRKWNHGAAMWNVYANSRILKDVFPGGRNRFAADEGNKEPMYAAVGGANNGAADSHWVLISVPSSVAGVIYCEGRTTACSSENRGFGVAKYLTTRNGMKVFRTANPVDLRSNMELSFVGTSGGARQTVRFVNR